MKTDSPMNPSRSDEASANREFKRIGWRSRHTGFVGHSAAMPARMADVWLAYLTARHPSGLDHWIEDVPRPTPVIHREDVTGAKACPESVG